MRREVYLGVGVGIACLLAVLALLVVPGTIASQESDAPGRLHVEEVTIAPGDVTGNAATLEFGVAIRHRGGPSRNVSLSIRAIDSESGLLAAETTTSPGRVTGDREHWVRTNLTVEREGGYDLVAILYEDGRRIDAERGSVQGVEGLSPTPITFKRFETGIPTIAYTIEETDADRTTLSVRTHLWNSGVESAEGATLEVVARQSESNVVADRASVDIGRIESGQTVTPTTELAVPSGYGYHLDAVLKHDGVIVSSASSIADLDPDREIEADTTFESVPFEAADFTEESDVSGPGEERRTTETSGPGLGPLAALLAIASFGIVLRIRGGSHD
ncbi:DUF7490 domain-containing protein [Halorhabdus amylolytica]|uniref:DUF7490 domain-containing protein n=1 Tax=Halorhabdus amylolytica TaxID=2559573 RepID=UPI0010AAEB3D|nr:PGF-CTERM sorting domain-containing protein [Halorhabdus amylolytica]